MRVVLDTNVVASALLWGGTPECLIEAAGDGKLELVTSEARSAEIGARYREIAEIVDATPIEEAALRDPDDAAVLACALAARAEAIVSGDGDLHALGTYQCIRILSPVEALALVGAST